MTSAPRFMWRLALVAELWLAGSFASALCPYFVIEAGQDELAMRALFALGLPIFASDCVTLTFKPEDAFLHPWNDRPVWEGVSFVIVLACLLIFVAVTLTRSQGRQFGFCLVGQAVVVSISVAIFWYSMHWQAQHLYP